MKLRRLLCISVATAAIASACGSEPTHDAASDAAARGLHSVDTTPPTTSATTTTEPTDPACIEKDPARSLRPVGPLPPPGHMPAGTFMQRIHDQGYLNAGVDQNTLGFGYRDARGNLQGFDLDLLREVARAIFGRPDAIRFRAVTSAQRQTAIENNEVDIVASVMSITCERWAKLDFSTEYYAAAQQVLVRADSPIRRIQDLNGRKVCATRGSTSIKQIRAFAPRAVLYPVDLRTECLVALQEGKADAISTDNTILYGLRYQDRHRVRILPARLHPERYGMAINQAHPDFVRFVNAVLEQVRTDGKWEAFHRRLEELLRIRPETPPAPEYRS